MAKSRGGAIRLRALHVAGPAARAARRVIALLLMTGIALPTSHAAALTEDDAKREYFLIKRDVLKAYRGPNAANGNDWVVFDCGFTDKLDFVGSGARANHSVPDWALQMFTLAKGVAQVRQTAIAAHYPDEAWRADLIAFEDRSLAGIVARTATDGTRRDPGTPWIAYPTDIVASMNAWRVQHRAALPVLRDIDGCGAGEASVSLKTKPEASRVMIIPEFFALICEKTGRADRVEACPYWRDVPKTNDLEVSGLYRFVASWPGGATLNGRLDFDKYLKDGEVVDVVIRAP